MNQTFKNDKKPSFGPDFGPHSVPQIFFMGLHSKLLLYVISRKTNEPNLRKW